MPTASSDPWRRLRNQIPAAQGRIYLNSGWSGPLPRPVAEAMTACLRRELETGPTTRAFLQHVLDLKYQLREKIAAQAGADLDEILLTQNTTEGLNIVLNGLPWRAGDIAVTTTVEHSSVLVPAYALRQRRGVDLRFVATDARDGAGEVLEKFAAAIVPGTRLVVLSHISYSTGQVFPLAEIQRLAHEAGARVLVDGAQSFGHVPLDLHGSQADYYAMPAHKWLLGPDGIGALYVRRDLIHDLAPAALAGRAAKTLDHAGGGYEPQDDDIGKFGLTTSSPVLAAGMSAALDFYQEAGPSAAWDRIRGLAARAGAALGALPGVEVLSASPGSAASGLVTFRLEGAEGSHLAHYLQTVHGVVCRGVSELNACRLSLHYFNTDTEIAQVVAAVAAVARTGLPPESAPVPLTPHPLSAAGR